MSLNYTKVQLNLQAVREEINELLNYIEANKSKEDKKFIDLEIYTRLADISTNVLQCDLSFFERVESAQKQQPKRF